MCPSPYAVFLHSLSDPYIFLFPLPHPPVRLFFFSFFLPSSDLLPENSRHLTSHSRYSAYLYTYVMQGQECDLGVRKTKHSDRRPKSTPNTLHTNCVHAQVTRTRSRAPRQSWYYTYAVVKSDNRRASVLCIEPVRMSHERGYLPCNQDISWMHIA